jgi:hypothetical protein
MIARLAAVLVIGLAFGAVTIQSGVAARPDCTEVGTSERDAMSGGFGRDVLCALGGDDFLTGNERRDVLRGGSGSDTLVGGKGRDRLRAGPGDDRLFAVDGRRGDSLGGGAGVDHCFGDEGDRFRGCHIHIGLSLELVEQLTAELSESITFAEELQATIEELEAIIASLPPAPSRSPVATFPPCTPPPGITPAPCPGG